ncbi:hypothetical protein WNZ14_15465 [Hoeflea sp. AS60]|uniref:hypothetical protein n=1 Tax=Hoeflea sp. AS60 TaxID=3135780 RepID=UPI0031800199
MLQDNRNPLRFLRAMLLVIVAAGLSACAGRPKPLAPTTPFTVTEVRVMASSVQDLGFAGRLQARLEASVGRTTSDVGQTSALRIVVQGLQEEPSPVNLFGGTAQNVSLDLSLVDSRTGQLLRTQVLRATSSDLNGSGADAMLIAMLTDDIRALLGLSGYTPYPVSGAKRDVVWPRGNPDGFDANDEAMRSADPLLNGTVTPTTVNLDVETDTGPVIDVSKPLLGENPTAKPTVPAVSVPAVPMTSPALVKVPNSLKIPAPEPRMVTTTEDAGSSDEPCIITLDNDCSDPDSR